MHPLIAFLSFIFGATDDWLIKRTFELAMNPKEMPAVVESFNRIRKVYPSAEDPSMLAVWAQILSTQGHPEEAMDWWKRSLKEADPQSDLADDINLRLGETALVAGDYEKAQTHFLTVIENDGSRAHEAKINSLISHIAQGQREDAHKIAKQLDVTPRSRFPLGLMAYADGQYEQAIEHFQSIEDDPRATYFVGLANRHLSQPYAALEIWDGLRKNNPSSKWSQLATFQVAETYFALGQDSLTRTICEDVIANKLAAPIEDKFVFRLASLDVKHGNYESALTHLAKISNTNSLADRAVVLAAESLIQMGDNKGFAHKLVKNMPKKNSAESMYQLAWGNAFEGRYERAMEVSQAGLEDFYHKELTPRTLLLQGLVLENLDDEAAALATYQTVVDRFPNTLSEAKAVHWTLLAYNRLGRHMEAVTHGNYMWNSLSDNLKTEVPDSAFWLAEANRHIHQYEEADAHYADFLVKAKPDNEIYPNAQFQKSIALSKLNQPQDALAMLDAFMETAEKQEQADWTKLAHLQKGHILFNNKDFELAIAHYRESDRNDKSLYYEGLALARLDYYLDAIDTWQLLAKNNPESPFAENASFKAAHTYFELNMTTHAVGAYDQFVKNYPDSSRSKQAMLQAAHAYYNVSQFEEAAPRYAQYLETYSESEDYLAVTPNLAAAYIQMDKTPQDMMALLRGHGPANPMSDVLWNEGAQHYNKEEFVEASTLFAESLAALPAHDNTPSVLFFYGESLFHEEKWGEAEAAFNHYLTQFKEDPIQKAPLAMFHRGITIYNQNRLFEAAEKFEEMAQLYPSDPLSNQAKQNMLVCYRGMGDLPMAEAKKDEYNIIEPDVIPVVEKPDTPEQTERAVYEVKKGTPEFKTKPSNVAQSLSDEE